MFGADLASSINAISRYAFRVFGFFLGCRMRCRINHQNFKTMTSAAELDPNARAAAQQALDELDEAASLARETIESPQAATEAPTAELSESEQASRNAERVQQFIKRAARQRNQGRLEMERTYTGVMVVDRHLQIFDPHIASSVTRFLALTDKTIYLLGRIGNQYMSDAQVEKVRDSIQEKIEEYAKEASQSMAIAIELSQKGRAENFMWIEPHYTGAALDFTFQIKSRNILALEEATKNWDEAIRLMCEMEFNACATASQVNEIRLRERRLFAAINRHCANIIFGMSRKSMAAAEKVTAQDSAAEQVSQAA